jgi:phosphoribosylformylglycinamidine synthase
VERIFSKWDLEHAVIGEVKSDGLLSFYMNGELEAELPAHELVLGGGAPQNDRAYSRPAYFDRVESFVTGEIPIPDNLKEAAEQLIQLPSIASKRWIFNQYDSMVGTNNTSTNAPSDAPVVAVRETGKGLAVTVDCNSRYVHADPYKGAKIAVAEAARNIVCSGGIPLGVTNCLNFGNPFDPEVYYQFVHAVKGMGEACIRFNTPVTGGNVSFYNQGPEGPVYPTPTIGMVGLVEDLDKKMTLDFKAPGQVIYLVGASKNDISSSEYLHKIVGVALSPAPYFNLEEEFLMQKVIRTLIDEGIISSAHDISEGGLFVALCESGFIRGLGFSISTEEEFRKDAYLFGEAQGRVVVCVEADNEALLLQEIGEVPATRIGLVTSGGVEIDGEQWGLIEDWKLKYDTALEKHLSKQA